MMNWEMFTEPLFESNCYILEEDGACIVVDPNDPAAVPERITRRGWTPELIFLTHEHCDHMAGLDALRARFPSARVIAGEACCRGLQDKRINMTRMAETYLAFSGKPGVSYPPFVPAYVKPSFTEELTLHWRGHVIRCIALPGHTPGSTGIRMDENVFFSGDYLLIGKEPVLRLPGGSEIAFRQITVPVLMALPKGIRVFPGHGEPYGLSDEPRNAGVIKSEPEQTSEWVE